MRGVSYGKWYRREGTRRWFKPLRREPKWPHGAAVVCAVYDRPDREFTYRGSYSVAVGDLRKERK